MRGSCRALVVQACIAWLCACEAQPPRGIFACTSHADCPPEQGCIEGVCDTWQKLAQPSSASPGASPEMPSAGASGGGGEARSAGAEPASVSKAAPIAGASVVGGAAAAGRPPTSLETPTLAKLGEPCVEIARVRCAGHAVRERLVCDGSRWQSTDACLEGQRCETRAGEAAGTCQPVAASCKERRPGERFCDQDGVYECGPDLLTVVKIEQCPSSAPMCMDGACKCLRTCNGVCSDTQTDAANCGSCGHDCRGARCTDGLCEPNVLARGLRLPRNFKEHGTELFFVMDPGLHAFPKAGGAARLIVPECYGYFFGGEDLYTTWMTVERRSLDGRVLETISDEGTGIMLLQDGAFYFPSAMYIYRLPSGATMPTVFAEVAQSLGDISADSMNLYWTIIEAGEVYKKPLSGGTVTRLATGQDRPRFVRSNGKDVYWANIGTLTGNLMMVPIGGGSPVTLTTGQIVHMTIDDSAVYYAKRGEVGKVAFGGREPLVLAKPTRRPEVAVDETYLYFLDGVEDSTSGPMPDATLNRVPK